MRRIQFAVVVLIFLLPYASFSQLSWSKEAHDLGDIQPNVPVVYDFFFQNYTGRNLEIDFIKTSCGCLKPAWEQKALSSQQSSSLRLTYQPTRTGNFEEVIQVFLKNSPYPQTLKLQGRVAGEEKNFAGVAVLSKPESYAPPATLIDDYPPAKPALPTTPPATAAERPVPTKPNSTKPEQPKPQPAAISSSSNLNTKLLPNFQGDEKLNTAKNAAYMTERERAMLKEINLVRSNPKGYIPVINAYIAAIEADIQADPSMASFYGDEVESARDLIVELSKTNPLPILQPHEKIYEAAKKHGSEGQAIGSLDHKGQDGSMPWDRIRKVAPDMQDGNENIVGGIEDIRKAVVYLLADSGIEGRGHRRTLLNPKWNYGACHEVGKVGTMPFSWLQNFGQSKNSSASTAPAQPEIPTAYEPTSLTDNPLVALDYDTEPVAQPQRPVLPSIPETDEAPATDANTSISADNLPPGKPAQSKPSTNAPITENQTEIPAETLPGRVSPAVVEAEPPAPMNPNSPAKKMLESSIATHLEPPSDAVTTENANFLTQREKEMIHEINFVRMYPKQYLKVLKSYLDLINVQIAKDPNARIFYDSELKAANELITLLENAQPVAGLKPNQKVYNATKSHGDDAKMRGNLEKQGSDGSMPWNRILKYAPDMMDGDENIIGGTSDIRRAVLLLLVDKKDPERKSRTMLLHPKWHYIACYEVGTVANIPNNWIQSFAQIQPTTSRTTPTSPPSKPAKTEIKSN